MHYVGYNRTLLKYYTSTEIVYLDVTPSNIPKKPYTDDASATAQPSPTKRKRRFSTPDFSFKEHRLYCGQKKRAPKMYDDQVLLTSFVPLNMRGKVKIRCQSKI